MEWRCEWCGKPHESDDPPCDACGHHKFERAIERVPAGDGDPQDPVWVCTECGRVHQKHSPPCSRCGNVDLEMRDQEFDESELSGTSYLDVLEPRYALGYALVAVFGTYLVLGMAGVVPLPTLGGEPAPPEAPGYNDTVGDVALADVEDALVAQVNDQRRADGADALDRDGRLDDVATYFTKRWVESAYEDADPPDGDEISEHFDVGCRASLVPYSAPADVADDGSSTGYEDAADFAGSVGPTGDDAERLGDPAAERVGVDVHVATDGRAFVTFVVC